MSIATEARQSVRFTRERHTPSAEERAAYPAIRRAARRLIRAVDLATTTDELLREIADPAEAERFGWEVNAAACMKAERLARRLSELLLAWGYFGVIVADRVLMSGSTDPDFCNEAAIYGARLENVLILQR